MGKVFYVEGIVCAKVRRLSRDCGSEVGLAC